MARDRPGAERSRSAQRQVVLIIDDDPAVRRVTARLLERGGFSTLVAPDGAAGQRLLRSQGEEIAVVLLDLTVPGPPLDGTLRQIQRLRLPPRLVLMSGYDAQDAKRHLGRTKPVAFLHKPFSGEALLAAVSRAACAAPRQRRPAGG